MATRIKTDCPLIPLRDWWTGAEDTAVHTVQLQPNNQNYPTGAISCSQCTEKKMYWRPDNDLDDRVNYSVYVNTQRKFAYDNYIANPAIQE